MLHWHITTEPQIIINSSTKTKRKKPKMQRMGVPPFSVNRPNQCHFHPYACFFQSSCSLQRLQNYNWNAMWHFKIESIDLALFMCKIMLNLTFMCVFNFLSMISLRKRWQCFQAVPLKTQPVLGQRRSSTSAISIKIITTIITTMPFVVLPQE